MQGIFLLLACSSACTAIFWLSFEERGTGFGWIPAGMAVLYVVGATQVLRQPFIWSLVLAGMQTVNMLLVLLTTGKLALFPLFFAIVAWVAVAVCAPAKRLLKANPDIDLSGVKAKTKKVLIFGGGLATIATALFAVIINIDFDDPSFDDLPRVAQKPPAYEQPDTPLEPTLKKFESAWAEKSIIDLASLYPDRLSKRKKRLGRRFMDHGFADFPDLSEARVREKGHNKMQATYQTKLGSITVTFEFESESWIMVALRM